MEKELIHRERLETFAYRLGVAGILSTFLIPVFLPFALGSAPTSLAAPARGSDKKYSKKGKRLWRSGSPRSSSTCSTSSMRQEPWPPCWRIPQAVSRSTISCTACTG